MGTFAEFPLLTIFVLVMIMLVMFRIFSPRKGSRRPLDRQGGGAVMGGARRACSACGTENPQPARYCRRCGKEL
jgi:hypothetical protein